MFYFLNTAGEISDDLHENFMRSESRRNQWIFEENRFFLQNPFS
tara:strand:- start:314 stop:445 length:132 start_codon:yes stop_codon:yes gene_type:complete